MKFQFDSLDAFLNMKGHGVYVWTCYAIVYAVLIFLTLSPLLQKKSFFKQQKKWQELQKNTEAH